MSDIHFKLKEMEEQIELKLKLGELDAAEKLSTEMVVLAEEYAQCVHAAAADATHPLAPLTTAGQMVYSPTSAALVERNEEHLRLLPIFHYVYAGYTALVSSFFAIHLVMGLIMIFYPGALGSASESTRTMGSMFTVIAALMLLCGWAWAVMNVYVARCMRLRIRHKLCFIVEVINCLSFPLGTTLGVSSLMVLKRPAVKEKFKS